MSSVRCAGDCRSHCRGDCPIVGGFRDPAPGTLDPRTALLGGAGRRASKAAGTTSITGTTGTKERQADLHAVDHVQADPHLCRCRALRPASRERPRSLWGANRYWAPSSRCGVAAHDCQSASARCSHRRQSRRRARALARTALGPMKGACAPRTRLPISRMSSHAKRSRVTRLASPQDSPTFQHGS